LGKEVASIDELNGVERKEIASGLADRYFSNGQEFELINEGPYSSVYRVSGENRVLKISAEHRVDLEELFYQVLEKYHVPAIENQRLSKHALCLEDIVGSDKWRLASKDDVCKGVIGQACAKWYQAFHSAGRIELQKNAAIGRLLSWEYDVISSESLDYAGKTYSLTGVRSWNEACEISAQAIAYLRPMVDTFTYNDFFYGNLAVSTQGEPMVTLIDFDHSGKGFAESDYRNVSYSLCGEALESFQASIPVNCKLLAIDQLMSVLAALVLASRRQQTPKWALQLVESVKTQEFSNSVDEAKFLMARA